VLLYVLGKGYFSICGVILEFVFSFSTVPKSFVGFSGLAFLAPQVGFDSLFIELLYLAKVELFGLDRGNLNGVTLNCGFFPISEGLYLEPVLP